MATIKPFKAIRPREDLVDRIAALPYDVYNRQEAKAIVKSNNLSFLQIDRGETLLADDIDIYDNRVYEAANQALKSMIEKGQFIEEGKDCYYVYELERNGLKQRGIVGCVLASEYREGIIKKHENTREVKEQDRIRHIDTLQAHTGPIFLAYKNFEQISIALDKTVELASVIFDFESEGVRHKGYMIEREEAIKQIKELTEKIEYLYIADGHHRAASAVKIANKYPNKNGADAFVAVSFPDEELTIMDYNRVIKDLNGLTKERFLQEIREDFEIDFQGSVQVKPEHKAEFGMFLENEWYLLRFKNPERVEEDPVKNLDVSILQDYLLSPILGIEDPRKDERIDFVGGIRGLDELEKRASSDMKIAFSMYPTSINELISVSNANRLMPPKSTWFEPKLLSGLFIHPIG